MTDTRIIRVPCRGGTLAVHHRRPSGKPRAAVLIVHGATFPTSLSSAYPIDGHSWFDDLQGAGFEVYGLDFLGYGESGHYPESGVDPEGPPGTAAESLEQLECAVSFIRARSPGCPLSLVAHSWGTIPAGMLLAAGRHEIARAVFYGPVVARTQATGAAPRPLPAFVDIDAAQQWAAFIAGVPAGMQPPIGEAEFSRWARAYLDSSRAEGASSVRIPGGPLRDLQRASGGFLPYDPAAIRVPSLVVRGTWDAVTTEEDSIRFLHALPASIPKRLVWIHGGTHRLHLEKPRGELFSEVRAFLDSCRSSGALKTRGERGLRE